MTNEEVYDEYAPLIHRFFANKVGAGPHADDLMQSTFLRFFERRATAEIREPNRYLLRIARNVLYEYWRARKRADLHEDIGELSLAALGANMSTLLSQDEQQRLVLDSLRELRLNYQIVTELFYWERLSYQEIASLLDVNQTTIGTWLRRGRNKLKEIMERRQQELEAGPRPSAGGEPDGADHDAPHRSNRYSSDAIFSLMQRARRTASARDDDDDDDEPG